MPEFKLTWISPVDGKEKHKTVEVDSFDTAIVLKGFENESLKSVFVHHDGRVFFCLKDRPCIVINPTLREGEVVIEIDTHYYREKWAGNWVTKPTALYVKRENE